MCKEPKVTLSQAINAYLDGLEERERRYDEAMAFCQDEEKAKNALFTVKSRMTVIENKKRDFIQRLFGLTDQEMSSAIQEIKAERLSDERKTVA